MKFDWWRIEAFLAGMYSGIATKYLLLQQWIESLTLGLFAFIFTILSLHDYRKYKSKLKELLGE